MVERESLIRNAAGPTVPAAVLELSKLHGTSLTFMAGKSERMVCSYQDVYDQMMNRGQQLLNRGLKKGDKVAFILPNPEDFVLSFLGAMAVGIVPVPMYPPLSLGKLDSYIDSTAKILERSDAKALITDAKMKSILWSLVDRVDNLKDLFTSDRLEKPALKKSQSYSFSVADLKPEDLAFLQFTSGSTSTPKGVIVTHGSLLANLDGIMNVGLKIDENDVAVSWLPLYHDMGLIGFMLAPVWYGVPTIYIPPLDFIKQPSRWMKAMNDYKGTIAFAPNFAYALAKRRTKAEKLIDWDLSHVKVMGCGAEPNHPGTLQSFLDHFAPAGLKEKALLPVYGMAEATLAVSFIDLEETMTIDIIDAEEYQTQKVANPISGEGQKSLEFVCCGRAFPEHRLSIINEDGEVLPERHVGQIVFEGASITPGYYKEVEKTKETFTEKGLLTGDLGYLADGELYVTGRMKDIIILNGRNYDPQSIEWIVQEIDGVRKGNVVSFSVPGAQTESLVIVAEIKDDIDSDALSDLIKTTVKEELFLSASDVLLVGRGQLPKTSSGKLQRRKTREQFIEGSLGAEGVRNFEEKGNRLTLAKHVAKSTVSEVKHRLKNKTAKLFSR